ncbi:MAG TPA: prepilin-type N-terminal cleavage/methylation domain-containing protein [Candidatus Ozemobacteraceae bacterium]|nr:prepilin-type N-terminal cleavage/methylation domain-containing protein [Candidatus Ozemobacteraceae bacterium]
MMNQTRHRIEKRASGFTLTEIIVTIILLAVIFGVAHRVLYQANLETQKGYWLQQRLTELRNGTRMISQRMKKTSYPSSIVREGGKDVVIAFKEWRRYDDSARLRDLQINPSTDFDMKSIEGSISPAPEPVSIMTFPVCTPEKDGQAGTITWVELVLHPDPMYNPDRPLGILHLTERETTYTSGPPKYAFGLSSGFSSSLPVRVDRELVHDVSQVSIASYSVDELRGVMVTEAGSVAKKYRRRYQVSVRIDCMHPRDEKIVLGDQCTVVSNVDLTAMSGGLNVVVLQINGSGPAATADITFNGTPMNVTAGSSFGNGWIVSKIYSNGLSAKHQGSNTSRFFQKKAGS